MFIVFLTNYGNNKLFEIFLYPYFEKQTISVDNFGLVVKLFRYLHNCCIQLDTTVRVGRGVPIYLPKFLWNKVPGKDDKGLLTSLNEIFNLIEFDKPQIRKTLDNNTLKVTTTNVRIDIKLDRTKRRAIASFADNYSNYREYEYRVVSYGSEIMVCSIADPDDSIRKSFDNTRGLIHGPIYEFVSDIGRSSSRGEIDNYAALAKDTKFMTFLEDLHKNFETGYKCLIEVRKKL